MAESIFFNAACIRKPFYRCNLHGSTCISDFTLTLLHGANNRQWGMTVLYGKCAGKTVRGLTKVKHEAMSFKPSKSLYIYAFLSRSGLTG